MPSFQQNEAYLSQGVEIWSLLPSACSGLNGRGLVSNGLPQSRPSRAHQVFCAIKSTSTHTLISLSFLWAYKNIYWIFFFQIMKGFSVVVKIWKASILPEAQEHTLSPSCQPWVVFPVVLTPHIFPCPLGFEAGRPTGTPICEGPTLLPSYFSWLRMTVKPQGNDKS